MSKIKLTIEQENEKSIVVESDYLIIMHGERKEDGTLQSFPIISGITYAELTRQIALLGWVAIEEFNKIRGDKNE